MEINEDIDTILSPLGGKIMVQDEYTLYEAGLENMLDQIGRYDPAHVQALGYDQRLRESISKARRYGDTQSLKAERTEVVGHLNNLMLSVLHISFNELCTLSIHAGTQRASIEVEANRQQGTGLGVQSSSHASGSRKETISWLHISDLHFRGQEYTADVVLDEMLVDIERQCNELPLQPDFVIVTGDIAFSGLPSEYTRARIYLDRLLAMTRVR